jgi:sulfur transfer complex TusBCD TusB component (DsrH family)
MYIKVFESRNTANWYILNHDISMRGLEHGIIRIENQDHITIAINENELFHAIDKLFKERLNEKRQNDD